MRYIFYADVYFIQNFMMKVAVLYLSMYFNKKWEKIASIKGVGRICIASLVGTIFEIIGLLLSINYSLFILVVNVFEIPLLLIGLMGKNRIGILKLMISSYFFTILINGVLEVLWNQFREYGGYIFYLLFSCGIVIVGGRLWRNYSKMHKGIYQVQLLHQGKVINISAFYDSGNRLVDPFTQKGVHVVSNQLIRKLGIVDKINTYEASEEQKCKQLPVYISYQSLGNETGMLEVYYLDKIMIEGEKGRKIIQNCPMGVTKDNLFEGKNYEMILNEEVF